MRNEKTWKERILPKVIESFAPRLRVDVQLCKVKELPPLQSLYIYGPVNSGKTVLTAFLRIEAERLNYLNAANLTILFTNTNELFNELRSVYGNPMKNEQEILDKYSNADILFLDDFGSERPTKWVLSVFYLLINRRYENLKTTIFTSNLSLEEVVEKFEDERIPSRIDRMCKVFIKERNYD